MRSTLLAVMVSFPASAAGDGAPEANAAAMLRELDLSPLPEIQQKTLVVSCSNASSAIEVRTEPKGSTVRYVLRNATGQPVILTTFKLFVNASGVISVVSEQQKLAGQAEAKFTLQQHAASGSKPVWGEYRLLAVPTFPKDLWVDGDTTRPTDCGKEWIALSKGIKAKVTEMNAKR